MSDNTAFEGTAVHDGPPSNLSADPVHRRWLLDQALELFGFFQPNLINPAGGFYALAQNGTPLTCQGQAGLTQHLHSTTRMVHCFALGQVLGIVGADAVIDHGMAHIWNRHRDTQRGGYFWGVDNETVTEPTKQAYGHAFVLLAASAAKRAGHPDADRMLADIREILETRFWEAEIGACQEDFSADWQPLAPYRGQNSNMHLTEALMAAFQATGDSTYLGMADRIADLIINRHARAAGWWVPEHFDATWSVDYGYSGNPMFRPAGLTPGHALEWSRLLVDLYKLGQKKHGWMPAAAEALFVKACQLGWNEAQGGFHYTLDWDNRPLQTCCLWWPCAEAIAAAHCLQSVSDNPTFVLWYRRVWAFVDAHFIDKTYGGWFPELNPQRQPVSEIFVGKPDLYHAVQACLIPLGGSLMSV